MRFSYQEDETNVSCPFLGHSHFGWSALVLTPVSPVSRFTSLGLGLGALVCHMSWEAVI